SARQRMSKDWAPQPAADVPDGLILFDGLCVLCSGWVRRVIERDTAARFRFAPIQDPYGAALARRFGISVDNPETNAAVIGGRIYFKSDAAVAVWARLAGWRGVSIFRLVPRAVRGGPYGLLRPAGHPRFCRPTTLTER